MRNGGVTGAPEIVEMLRALGDPERAVAMQRYFKTGPGEYAEGDLFLGITVPQVRKLAARLGQPGLPETVRLLRSPIHEARLLRPDPDVQRVRKGGRGHEGVHIPRIPCEYAVYQ